jgi:hypothetical protein
VISFQRYNAAELLRLREVRLVHGANIPHAHRYEKIGLTRRENRRRRAA